MNSILVLNGPNLNLLGTREPGLYGTLTLGEIESMSISRGRELGLHVECRQSNHEGQLIDWIHDASGRFDAIVLNAGGYTHTSVALMDAISAVGLPTVELHLTDIFAREEFRRTSYIGRVACNTICGHGAKGYVMAIDALARRYGTGQQPETKHEGT